MASRSEEEVYSVMFKSLKHPVRRRILGLLNDKPLGFMEIASFLDLSSSHLTYHLESLGELVAKTPNGEYQLSSFGKAAVNAMKGVQEAPELAVRRPKKLARRWKVAFAALMVAVLLLSSFGVYQYITITQLAADQSQLEAQNQQLLSWGIGAGTVADMLRDVVQLDTNRYRITLLSDMLEYREDFDVAEEVLRYSFTGASGDFEVSLRFRENHLSRYQLTTDTAPLLIENPPSDSLAVAKAALMHYSNYSGDAYLSEMQNLLNSVNATTGNLTVATSGNMKLQISSIGNSDEYLWMYTHNGVDYNAMSLRLTFTDGALTALTDGYFLFTASNAKVNLDADQAVNIAQNYIQTLTWTINGTQTSGFKSSGTISVQMLPHPRANSVALVPYWYITLQLDRTYPGGFNTAAVGVWADSGEVADAQLLSR
ncbi:winged helix-turn-helix transcriptional regulator [Candidatus Bathyarchaeota archaeon]|nr:winged helix-turn-helix transcriptional regulator [Candidatus Bathyarchaeota archaeon]